MLWIRLVRAKKGSLPEMTSQRALMPAPRAYASSETSISATPPPRAVELTFHTTRPSSRVRPWSAASRNCANRSGSSTDAKRSYGSADTGTLVRAVAVVGMVRIIAYAPVRRQMRSPHPVHTRPCGVGMVGGEADL